MQMRTSSNTLGLCAVAVIAVCAVWGASAAPAPRPAPGQSPERWAQEVMTGLFGPDPGFDLLLTFDEATKDPARLAPLLKAPQVAGGPAALARARQALAGDVPNWDRASLARPMPSREQNAAPDLEELSRLLKERPLDDEASATLSDYGRTPAKRPALRRLLDERHDLVGLAHRAAQRPLCVPEWDPTSAPPSWSSGTRAILYAYRLLRGESRLLALDGRSVEAVRTQAAVLRLANHISTSEPGLASYLAGLATERVVLSGLADILGIAGPDPAVAAEVVRLLSERRRPGSLRRAMAEDVVWHMAAQERLRAKALAANPRSRAQVNALFDWMESVYLEDMRRILDASELPYAQSSARFREVAGEVGRSVAKKDLLAAFRYMVPPDRTPRTQALADAKLTVVLAAAQVMGYRAAHGGWPETLAQAAPRPPADPCTGKALGYRREGEGFVVWSAGAGGKFDGGPAGSLIRGDDIGFRYSAPAVPR